MRHDRIASRRLRPARTLRVALEGGRENNGRSHDRIIGRRTIRYPHHQRLKCLAVGNDLRRAAHSFEPPRRWRNSKERKGLTWTVGRRNTGANLRCHAQVRNLRRNARQTRSVGRCRRRGERSSTIRDREDDAHISLWHSEVQHFDRQRHADRRAFGDPARGIDGGEIKRGRRSDKRRLLRLRRRIRCRRERGRNRRRASRCWRYPS